MYTCELPTDKYHLLACALQLLGETTLLSEQASRSVAAYEKAIQLRDNDLQIATGLVDAYIANGQQSKAVDYLVSLRNRLIASGAAPAAPGSEAASTSTSASAIKSMPSLTAPPLTGEASSSSEVSVDEESLISETSASNSASTSSNDVNRPIKDLDPVSLELLLAKTFSGWRGHENDALGTYDVLIARFPEDFRGYLAKGVFLKERGRKADAERMFLQVGDCCPQPAAGTMKSWSNACTDHTIHLNMRDEGVCYLSGMAHLSSCSLCNPHSVFQCVKRMTA